MSFTNLLMALDQQLVHLGAFFQHSQRLVVADPSTEPPEYIANSDLLTFDVMVGPTPTGWWQGYVLQGLDHPGRNIALIALAPSVPLTALTEASWTRVGSVGVDSGQAGIYDLSTFVGGADDDWYASNLELTLSEPNYGGVLSDGVVSSAGYGDGIYAVWTLQADGLVIGVWLHFIDSSPDL